MGYGLMGRFHAAILGDRGGSSGQGTVEYVALILLVAAILTGVVAAASGQGDGGIPAAIMKKLKTAIDGVVPGGSGR